MTRYFAADVRLFEDVHRLQQQRLVKTEHGGEFPYIRIAREATKHGIEIVKSVSDLVDRLFLGILERAIGIEGVLFEEETNLVAGSEEVIIRQTILFVRRENRNNFRRIKRINQLLSTRAQNIAIVVGGEVFDHEKAVGGVLFYKLLRKHRQIV